MKLHHIGVATDDAEAMATLYQDLLDAPLVHEERFDDLDVKFLELAGGYLECIEPVGTGTVSRFLEKQGPGMHHLAFQTSHIERRLADAASLGISLIDKTPRSGAWGHDVAFLHPADTGGVLIEFVDISE